MAWLFLAVVELLMFGWPAFLAAQLLMLFAGFCLRLRWWVVLIPTWVFLVMVAFVAVVLAVGAAPNMTVR